MPPASPSHYAPSSSSGGIEVSEAAAWVQRERERIRSQMVSGQSIVNGTQKDWDGIWDSAIRDTWLCSVEDLREIEESFIANAPKRQNVRGPRQDDHSHYLVRAPADLNEPRWRSVDGSAVFTQSYETALVANFAALATSVLDRAHQVATAKGKTDETWARAAQDHIFVPWESQAIEMRGGIYDHETDEDLAGLVIGDERQAVGGLGHAKSGALLLHRTHHAHKGKAKAFSAEQTTQQAVFDTEIRLVMEAKAALDKAAYDDAEHAALLRALLVKNRVTLMGNVWMMVIALSELTLYCVNAGVVIRMPVVDAEKSPQDFIRLILLAASHGSSRDFWDHAREQNRQWASDRHACPDFLQPQDGDTISLLPLLPTASSTTSFPPADLDAFLGSMEMKSTVTNKDWYFRPGKQGYPLRLCGSRTAVFGSQVILKYKPAGTAIVVSERQNVVTKFSFPKRASLTTEAAACTFLRASAKLPNGVKRRVPNLLLFGQASVDQHDPFYRHFGRDERYRVATIAVFQTRHWTLYDIERWQAAFVLADICFTMYALFTEERVMHGDISAGNICSLLDRLAYNANKTAVVDRFTRIAQVLSEEGEWYDALVSLDEVMAPLIGCFIDFGNAKLVTQSVDTSVPSRAEAMEEVASTRSATYAFWSTADWARYTSSKGQSSSRTWRLPEDEVESLLYVFLAVESSQPPVHDTRQRWTTLSADEIKQLATMPPADVEGFRDDLTTKVALSARAVDVAVKWRTAIRQMAARKLLDPTTAASARKTLFMEVQSLLIAHGLALAG